MALSNSERQKRWLEKNRALHNFRRRKKKGGDATCSVPMKESSEQIGEAAPTVRSSGAAFETKKVGEFRMLVLPPKESEEEPVKPAIYRNDYGAVISERAWKQLQERKRRAKEGNYHLDEYSQG